MHWDMTEELGPRVPGYQLQGASVSGRKRHSHDTLDFGILLEKTMSK